MSLNSAGGPRLSADMTAACVSIALGLVTGLVFSPVLTAGLVTSDDADAFRAARLAARSWQDSADVFAHYQTPRGTGGYYQPLTVLSYGLDFRLARDPVARVFQSHLTNLMLHVINTALLYTLLCRMISLRRAASSAEESSRAARPAWTWPALLSLLFAFHPLQVETVAWISQRMTLLATFFSLLALLAYVRYRTTDRFLWLAGASMACAAAILSKPTFIGLPVVLMVLDLWPLDRPLRKPLLARLPLLAILLSAAAVQSLIFGHVPMATAEGPAPLELFSKTLASFVTRLFWPVGLLPFNPLDDWSSASHFVIWRDLALTSLLIVLPLWAFFRCRPLFTALVGGLLFVCPAFLNAPFTDQRLSDQYLYPVLIPSLMVIAAWIGGCRPSFHSPFVRCAAIAQVAMAAVLAVQTYSQTFTWQSGRDLYRATVRMHPAWSQGYVGLIEAVIAENDFDAALVYAKKAVGVAPEDPSTQFYLGTALLLQTGSRAAEAIAPLRKALASNPNWIECLQNLGVALARRGQFDKAIEYLERARDLEPNSAGIRLGLGNSYLKVHRAASARRELQESLRLHNTAATHFSLAMAWAANDAPDLARRHLAAAVARDPRMAARAAASEELRRFRDRPGFESLIDGSDGTHADRLAPDMELPAARNARGS